MNRIKINEDEQINVVFTSHERTLILKHTFADPELTERLEKATDNQGKLTVGYTLYEIEELSGFVAAEANNTDDKKLESDLQRLFDRLSDVIDQYDDGNLQGE